MKKTIFKQLFLIAILLSSFIACSQNPFPRGLETLFVDPIPKTNAELNAMTNVPTGRLAYSSDDTEWKQYDGSSWIAFQGSSGGIPDAPSDGSEYVRQNGNWVINSGGSSPIQNITSPLDPYHGLKIQGITNLDGFYTESSNNNSISYMANATGSGNGVVAGFYGILNSDINNYMFAGKIGSGYFVPYLQGKSLIYASDDLHIQTATNNDDIIFSLGNTPTNDITESAKNKVLFLNQDLSIKAPLLSNVVINGATSDVLTTKNWIQTYYQPIASALSDAPSDGNTYGRNNGSWTQISSGGGTWGSITGTLSNQLDLQSALNLKQNNIALTTSGTSGAATFDGTTLNIPQYTAGGGGNVVKVGTPINNEVGVWTGDGTIEGDSGFRFDNSTIDWLYLGEDNTTASAINLHGGATSGGGLGAFMRFYNNADQDSNVDYWMIRAGNGSSHGDFLITSNGSDIFRIDESTLNTYLPNQTIARIDAGPDRSVPTKEWVLANSGSGGGTWGSITGTLSSQTDLQSALDDKVNLTGGSQTVSASTTFDNGGTSANLLVNSGNEGPGLLSTVTGVTSSGIVISNSSTNGDAVYANNLSTGVGINVRNQNSGEGVLVDGLTSATGFNYVGQDNGTNTFTVNKTGDIIANSYNGIDLTTSSSNWNTAFGWGDHSIAGYLTSSSLDDYTTLNTVQNITAIKNFNNGGGITMFMNSNVKGLDITSTSTMSENLIRTQNIGVSNIGVLFDNANSGKNLVLNNHTAATGTPFTVQKNNVDVATISDTGAYTGISYNGVALTTSGSANTFLNGQGNYTSTVTADSNTEFTGVVSNGINNMSISSGVVNWTGQEGNLYKLILTQSTTIQAPSSPITGATYMFIVEQNSSGLFTLAYDTNVFKFIDGNVPAVNPNPNSKGVLTAIYDGTHLLVVSAQNFL